MQQQQLTNSGGRNKSYDFTIWNETLIQKSAVSDQKLVLDLVPYCVVAWDRALYMQLLLKVQYKIHYTLLEEY